jgi:hypothetical protein
MYRTLLWRVICDLGVAARFLLTPAFNLYVCQGGDKECAQSNAGEFLFPTIPYCVSISAIF